VAAPMNGRHQPKSVAHRRKISEALRGNTNGLGVRRARRPLEQRLIEKIDVDGAGGCWLWTSALDWGGYPIVWIGDGVSRRAHRVVYELYVEPIPPGLQLDHLCGVRRCVNPDHLEAVTGAINVGRSPNTPMARKRAQTHCRRGHPFDLLNTRWSADGRRSCRACETACVREHRR
jgi:HNH endonuclease